jgi:hypothetical protein
VKYYCVNAKLQTKESIVETVQEVRNWEQLAHDHQLEKVVKALEANNITPVVVNNGEEARQKVLELVPEGSEVFTATSATLAATGIAEAINESGRYNSVRKKMMGLNRETQFLDMRRLASTPEYALGSAHAVTEQGYLMIASYGGSQLPALAYGAGRVIFVIGINKIVSDVEEGFRRIEEHSLPLESERLQKAVGRASEVGKILILRKEPLAGRITVVLVKEKLGF